MIVNIDDFYNYFYDEKINNVPKIFENARKINISSLQPEICNWASIAIYNVLTYLDDRFRSAGVKIPQTSIEEYVYLKDVLNSNIDDIKDAKILSDNIRVFKLDKYIPNYPYRIMEFTTSNIVNGNNISYISLFVGSNFEIDDVDSLVYDLSEYIINQKLEEYNVEFNLISCKNNIQKTIVMNAYPNPSDAKFIVDYYSTVFCILLKLIPSIENFKDIKNCDNGRRYIFKFDDMVKIFEFSKKCFLEKDTEDDYIEINSFVFEKLLESSGKEAIIC